MPMDRRNLLRLGILASIAFPDHAHAWMAFWGGQYPPDGSPRVAPDGHISYGQSWRANDFINFALFLLNPNGPLALHVPSLGTSANFQPGPMPNSAGINITSLPDGITNYRGTDTFSIGRCAILANQLLRIRDGQTSLTPILECCFAYPGSTWTTGGGGGLAPGAAITGSISGTTLTVTSVASGVVAGGQLLVGAGINPLTRIYDFLGGTGGTGTYILGIALAALTGTFIGTSPAGNFTGSMNNGVLTITAVNSGSAAVNQVITGGSLPAGSIIVQQLSGAAGGIGVYQLGLPQTVGSESIAANGVSWANQLTVLNIVKTFTAKPKYLLPVFSSVGYTQGSASDSASVAAKAADLTDMIGQYDALALNPTPLKFYLGLPCPVSNAVSIPSYSLGEWGTYGYCRTNAPGAGGAFSGRVYATAPSYPWQFNGGDNIHTGNYGTARWGEWEGYVRWLAQDKGVAFTPLWRPLTGGAITIAGQVITVPFARPTAPDFAASVMSWVSDPIDGIKVWPQNGWHVQRLGVDLTVTPSIVGLSVHLAIVEALAPGDVLEVSYAWYGPGGPNPGISTGVGGNLTMTGPDSVLFPGKTIDAWAWPFAENVTV